MNNIVPAVLAKTYDDFKSNLALFSSLQNISRVQIDVVDGEFAKPMSWPYTAPKELRGMVSRADMLPHLDRIVYEIDLMCLDAEDISDEWLALGASRLTVHAESAIDLQRLLAKLRMRYCGGENLTCVVSIGLAINIESSLSLIEPYINSIEYVQFMGISRIGKQGQPFDRRVLDKIRVFHKMYPNTPVQVDGGVSLDTAPELLKLGVSDLIVGSAITHTKNPHKIFTQFENIHRHFGV